MDHGNSQIAERSNHSQLNIDCTCEKKLAYTFFTRMANLSDLKQPAQDDIQTRVPHPRNASLQS